MRNSSAALSFKLKTTASSAGRGNQAAVAGGNATTRVGDVENLEKQAGQVGASLSQDAVPLHFSQQTSLSFCIAYIHKLCG